MKAKIEDCKIEDQDLVFNLRKLYTPLNFNFPFELHQKLPQSLKSLIIFPRESSIGLCVDNATFWTSAEC